MRNRLNKLFWFTDARRLDPKKDKNLIIHQTLAYGSLEDMRYLFRLYPKRLVKKIFLAGKRGWYDPRVLALLKIIFGVKKIDKSKFLKNVY